jgi:hypothetical protein
MQANMKKTSGPFSELKNPSENMTPSVKTITSTILVLLPLVLFFLNLFTGFIKL